MVNQVPRTNLFVGFSTQDSNLRNQNFADLELVKRDLMNTFFTRPGERLMMPTYGCGIWDLLFEPFDEYIKDQIVAQCEAVIATDPRVQLINTVVTQVDQGLRVQMDLLYVPWGVVTSFSLDFDQRSSQMF